MMFWSTYFIPSCPSASMYSCSGPSSPFFVLGIFYLTSTSLSWLMAVNLFMESERYWIILPSSLSKMVRIRWTPVRRDISIAFFMRPFFLLFRVTYTKMLVKPEKIEQSFGNSTALINTKSIQTRQIHLKPVLLSFSRFIILFIEW